MRQGTNSKLAALLVAATWLIGGAASAQVFKCKDAGGHVTYSNVGCEANQAGKAIMREPTVEEKLRERGQAFAAETAKKERREREALAQQIESEQQLRQQEMAQRSMVQNPLPNHKGYAERLAERNSSIKPNLVPYHEAERQKRLAAGDRARSQSAQPPSNESQSATMTHCKGKWCYDSNGGAHAMGSNGSFTTENGQVCKQKGDKVHCF